VTQSTGELTGRIAAGDEEALAAFYRARFDSMFRQARRDTGRDESFCLDVVHDTMLRVISALPRIDDERALQSWVRRTVRSCAYDALRRDARRRRREEAVTASGQTVRDEPEWAERRAWLRRELGAIDQGTSVLLFLRYRLGATLAQIGGLVGLKPGAVDGRIRRGLSDLHERATESGND
jgi:RNA polymerase sigma factor (sigma-70 family)